MGEGTQMALGSPLSPVRPAPVRRAGAAFEDHLAPAERGGRPAGEPLHEGRPARANLGAWPGGALPSGGLPTGVKRGGRPHGEPPREDLRARANLVPCPGGPLPPASRPTRTSGHHRPPVHSGHPVPCRGTAVWPLPSPVPDVRRTTPGLG